MKQVRGRLGLSMILLVAVAVAGCGNKENEVAQETTTAVTSTTQANATEEKATDTASTVAYPRTFTHAMGEITLEKQPERIYAPYMEDALLTLGVKPVLKWSLGPLVQQYLEPQLQDVPKIDFSSGENSEQILAAQPDLIVLYSSEMAGNGVYETDSKIAPTYVFPDAAGNWQDTITQLGDILNKPDQAARAIADYDTLVEEARTQLAPITDGKTFATLRIKAKELTLMDGTYFSGATLYGDLGLTAHEMVKNEAWENFIVLSMEALPDLDADYIFYTIQGEDAQENANRLLDSELWKNLPAVKAGHAYLVENNYWLASGSIANTMQIEDVLRLVQP